MNGVQTAKENNTLRMEQLQAQNVQLQQQVQALKHQLDWFKRQLFGEKSEKRLKEVNPDQLSIGELLPTVPPIPEDQPKQEIRYTRGKNHKNHLDGSPSDSGLRFDETVPVKEIQLSAPQLSGDDADDYEVVSSKTTYRLAQRPGSYVVLKYTRPVVKHKASRKLHTATAPVGLWDKSFMDVSFVAGMLVDKFLYHQPLYRQHQKLKANGIVISRSSLTNGVHRGIELLRPIYDAQYDSVLRSRVLAMDETPIKAGRKSKGKMHKAYYWPLYGDRDEVVFTFSRTRGIAHVKSSLAEFSGTLVSDGYSAYEHYARSRDDVTHAQCWSHTRRTFEKAQDIEPEAVSTALEFMGQLYGIEKTIRKEQLFGEAKLAWRSEHSKPIVDDLFTWIYDQRQRLDLVPSNPLSKALSYADQRKAALSVFLSDPEVPLDTNHLERALRVIPMGRKSWLFCWTEIGAELVGIIQSLLVTCRLHHIDPYVYLVDVLQRVSSHPMSRVDELIPRNWKTKFADNPLISDLKN
ncbi:MAG: IS66 family transposase [Desulfobacterales bacterium]|nr:IS66 family transposase [Desulfobacterales bacterium]